MNPKLADSDSLYARQMAEYHHQMEEYEKWVAFSMAEKRAKANQTLDDLKDALGADITGTSIDGDFEHARIPLAALQLITARLQALAAGDPLAEGRL